MKKGNSSVMGGLVWSFAERISSQVVSTIVSILLARILLPDDYGVIALVMVFISICDVFVTSGFGSALVQKKEVEADDYDTAFILSLCLAFVLYVILFIFAPLIGRLYESKSLCSILRVLGLRILVTSFNAIQQSYIRRNMEFRRFFVVTIGGTISSGIVGIVMALTGYGAWAIVAQYLTNSIVSTVMTFRICAWKPHLRFSGKRALSISRFGWKILCSQLIATTQNDIRSLIVGKVFGATDLAYFDQGKRFPALFITNVNSALNRVMLPTFAQVQEDLPRLKEMLRKAIRLGMFIIVPLLIGLFSVAESFVRVVLTDKWLDIIPYLQIFCLLYVTRPMEEMCHQAIIAVGRSDISLRILTAINITALGAVALAVFVFRCLFCVAVFSLAHSLVSVVCFMCVTKKLFNYRVSEQLTDIMPAILISTIMGIVVSAISMIPTEAWIRLIMQILIGFVIYVSISKISKLDSYEYIEKKVLALLRK